MVKIRLLFLTCVALGALSIPSVATADWTMNVGYHNPTWSTLGLNLLKMNEDWGFEFGVGYVDWDTEGSQAEKRDDKDQKEEDTVRVRVAGDLDVKYLIFDGNFKPYVQLGTLWALGSKVGEDNDIGASLFDVFSGVGLMLGSKNFYGYAAYNFFLEHENNFQAGLGIDI